MLGLGLCETHFPLVSRCPVRISPYVAVGDRKAERGARDSIFLSAYYSVCLLPVPGSITLVNLQRRTDTVF